MAEVFFSPITSVHENKSPGCVLCGRPGGGKSFCMVNMAANALDSGCNVFILDAKNDTLPLKNLFPSIKVTDVNNIAKGALDPFLVFEDVDATMIITIVEMLCGSLDNSQKLAITPIISDFVTRVRLNNDPERDNFRSFAEYLFAKDNEAARAVGNQLLLNADSKYGPLLFGEQGKVSRGLKLTNESRIISILGMQLPSGSSIPKPDELVNAAIIYIICRMIKNILTRNKEASKTPTVFMLDECHMLMRSVAIEDIIDEFLVLGRSLNVAVVMASQNVTHFRRDMAQQISSKFAFQLSVQEAQEFMNLFGLASKDRQVDIENSVNIISKLQTGYCFVIDSNGRASVIHIDSNYDKNMLSSNPLEKKHG